MRVISSHASRESKQRRDFRTFRPLCPYSKSFRMQKLHFFESKTGKNLKPLKKCLKFSSKEHISIIPLYIIFRPITLEMWWGREKKNKHMEMGPSLTPAVSAATADLIGINVTGGAKWIVAAAFPEIFQVFLQLQPSIKTNPMGTHRHMAIIY